MYYIRRPHAGEADDRKLPPELLARESHGVPYHILILVYDILLHSTLLPSVLLLLHILISVWYSFGTI